MTARARRALHRLRAWACCGLAWPVLVLAQPAPAVPAPPSPPSAPSAPSAGAGCPPAAVPLDPATIPQGLRAARDRGALWRVEQGGRTSWLYGTVHAAYRDWMLPGPTVLAAVRASDVVALELDPLDPAIAQALQAAMRQPPGAPPLPPALAQRLHAQAVAACAADALAPLRPEMQVAALSVMAGRRDGIDPAYGTDLVLAGLARGLRLPVLSLETPQLQIAALSAGELPGESAQAVDSGLRALEAGHTRDSLRTLVQAWADGRTALLATYAQWCDCMDSPADRAAFERVVTARNPALAASIAARHRSGSRVFAAVGALHMVGADGLPALLAAQGFRVERVRFEAAPPAAQGRAPARAGATESEPKVPLAP